MTIELWYNRCMLESGGSSSSSSDASQLPSTNLSCESSPTVVNDYHKPATGGGVAYITDFGRTELTGQLSAVIKSEHPVYKLMQLTGQLSAVIKGEHPVYKLMRKC
ncbi:unnamed protein product [Trichobilharzia regenti]|nr:unnamed protein product [Trichobilharzia regenti]